MGLGNLNPGSGAIIGGDAYAAADCSCCCDATAHSGKIFKSFFPWIRKIRVSTPKSTVDFDPPNISDSWFLSKTDTWDPTVFAGVTIETPTPGASVLVSPTFSCQVEWYAYSPTAGRYRDNSSSGIVRYKPVASHSVIVAFTCVSGKPRVTITLATSQEISVELINFRLTPAPDTVLHSGTDTFVRHSTGWLYNSSSETDGVSTYPLTSIPLFGTRVFNPDMGFPGGFQVPSYGPTAPTAPPTHVYYSYGEGQQFAPNAVSGVLAPDWNPLGIMGVSVELLA